VNVASSSLIVSVMAAHLLALLSPGPDFILVVKSGIRNKRNTATGIAFGIAAANALYITLCIIGIGQALSSSLTLMRILRGLGGLFLSYVAFMALKAKKEDYDHILNIDDPNHQQTNMLKEFATGFI